MFSGFASQTYSVFEGLAYFLSLTGSCWPSQKSSLGVKSSVMPASVCRTMLSGRTEHQPRLKLRSVVRLSIAKRHGLVANHRGSGYSRLLRRMKNQDVSSSKGLACMNVNNAMMASK